MIQRAFRLHSFLDSVVEEESEVSPRLEERLGKIRFSRFDSLSSMIAKSRCSVIEGSDPCPRCFTRETVELFGYLHVTCLSLRDNAASLFMCFCKHMNVAMDSVTASSGGRG